MADRPCAHLDVSDEAVSINTYGRHTAITVHLCSYPDNEPGLFVDMPRWLLRQIGPGLAIEPKRDCVGCPAFKEKSDE